MNVDENECLSESVIEKNKKNAESVPGLSFRDSMPQIVASCVINLIVIQAGINMAFSSILIPQLSLPDSDIKIDLDSSSTVASIVTLSIAFGALICGPLMDKYGRKRLSTIICVPFMFAWLLIALSRNLFMIYTARVLSGFCGGLTTVALVYVSEISSPQNRGMLLCLNSVAVSLGIILTYFFNIFFQWRTIGFIYAFISLLSLLIIMRIPESPSWILVFSTKKQHSQALISLEWIYRKRHLSTFYYHQLIDNEKLRQSNLEGNETAAAKERESFMPLLAKVFRQPQVYKPLIILLFMFLFQQCSGCYILIFYTINIFRNLSLNFSQRINENMALMLLGALRLVVSVIASGLARKCHRKTLLYISSLGMMTFIFASGILVRNMDGFTDTSNFLTFQETSNDTLMDNEEKQQQFNTEVYLLVTILCYIAFSSLGVMILPWTLISELFPIEVKGKMSGIIVLIAYFIMFFAVKIFPYSLNMYGMEVMFYLFAISSFAFCTFVYYFLPETYGKSLNDIQKHFTKQ
ncbi:hypothetical protein PVAND_002293 [Polypedilum vanderplanki]|uniref:Major facilitator superfamily (MFS) profile domain-containing protein n=1 Tax=Polypedilum vanderplanki TaxID=319348 RepID=A0A9J6BRR4_POLVA|nr:hypothetical protein PVAND_002293 [Polypedilum vanderplanki]